jgi:hypothetical protein
MQRRDGNSNAQTNSGRFGFDASVILATRVGS